MMTDIIHWCSWLYSHLLHFLRKRNDHQVTLKKEIDKDTYLVYWDVVQTLAEVCLEAILLKKVAEMAMSTIAIKQVRITKRMTAQRGQWLDWHITLVTMKKHNGWKSKQNSPCSWELCTGNATSMTGCCANRKKQISHEHGPILKKKKETKNPPLLMDGFSSRSISFRTCSEANMLSWIISCAPELSNTNRKKGEERKQQSQSIMNCIEELNGKNIPVIIDCMLLTSMSLSTVSVTSDAPCHGKEGKTPCLWEMTWGCFQRRDKHTYWYYLW